MKKGRPKFEATPEIKKQVEALAGYGIPQEQIGAIVGCSDDTLRKYFAEDLLKGKAKANAQIAQTLFNKAKSGDTSALIFWAKTQMKWKETTVNEITGENGGPLEISEAKQKLLSGIIPKEK